MPNVVQKAPNTVLAVCGTVVILSLVGALTVLALQGKDAGTLTQLVSALLSTLGSVTGTGALLYASAAARSSAKAEEQTNGSLDARMRTAIRDVINEDRKVS